MDDSAQAGIGCGLNQGQNLVFAEAGILGDGLHRDIVLQHPPGDGGLFFGFSLGLSLGLSFGFAFLARIIVAQHHVKFRDHILFVKSLLVRREAGKLTRVGDALGQPAVPQLLRQGVHQPRCAGTARTARPCRPRTPPRSCRISPVPQIYTK